MIKCPRCDFEAKNEVGLIAHMRKHKREDARLAESQQEEIKDEVIIEPEEIVEEIEEDNVIETATITLHEGTKWIAEYIVSGQGEIEKAKAHAKRKGYEIEIKGLTKVHI